MHDHGTCDIEAIQGFDVGYGGFDAHDATWSSPIVHSPIVSVNGEASLYFLCSVGICRSGGWAAAVAESFLCLPCLTRCCFFPLLTMLDTLFDCQACSVDLSHQLTYVGRGVSLFLFRKYDALLKPQTLTSRLDTAAAVTITLARGLAVVGERFAAVPQPVPRHCRAHAQHDYSFTRGRHSAASRGARSLYIDNASLNACVHGHGRRVRHQNDDGATLRRRRRR
jgi:hypothetical protein